MINSVVGMYNGIFKNSKGKSAIYSVSREQVLSDFDSSIELLGEQVLGNVEQLNLLVKEKVVDEKALMNVKFIKLCASTVKQAKGKADKFIEVLFNTCSILIDKDDDIRKGLKNCFKGVSTTDKTINSRELAAIEFVKSLNLFVTFTSDLILYTAFNIRGGIQINKKYEQRMMNSISAYTDVVQELSDNNIVQKVNSFASMKLVNVGAAMDEIENNDTNTLGRIGESIGSSVLELLKGSGFVSMSRSGFIGNPIYHLRMWWADFQHSRYESLKENKAATEAILLDLRLKKEGTNDPNLDKQIKYYEEKLESMQYKISQYEDEL